MKNADPSIRAYDEATDLHALSAIWFEASRLAHAFIGEQRLSEQRILIEEKYLPNAETWVACLDGAPVGFISLLDTFIGGLTAGLVEGLSLDDAVALGQRASALCVTRHGAQPSIPYRREIV